jgi:hypothetical protein
MKIQNNKKSQYSPYGLSDNSVVFIKGLKLIEGELKALLTCAQDTIFFRRFASRTMIMLKKEPNLRQLWKSAVERDKTIKAEREQLLVAFQKHREALQLDGVIRSLSIIYESTNRDGERLLPEGQLKCSSRLAIPIEFSDMWIKEVATWLKSQQMDPTTNRGIELMELRQSISKWEEANRTWYPIGDHPQHSLARLIHLEEWIEFFLGDEGLYEPPSLYFNRENPQCGPLSSRRFAVKLKKLS